MWKVILLSVVFIGIAIAAIAIRMFVKKDGEFKKSCSSVDSATGRSFGCTCGNNDDGVSCENKSSGPPGMHGTIASKKMTR